MIISDIYIKLREWIEINYSELYDEMDQYEFRDALREVLAESATGWEVMGEESRENILNVLELNYVEKVFNESEERDLSNDDITDLVERRDELETLSEESREAQVRRYQEQNIGDVFADLLAAEEDSDIKTIFDEILENEEDTSARTRFDELLDEGDN